MHAEPSSSAVNSRQWRFGQCFGEKGESDVKLTEADVLSAVRFDDTGDYLATGDRGGRIVVFERSGGGKHSRGRNNLLSQGSDASGSTDGIVHAGDGPRPGQPGLSIAGPGSAEYRFYTEFQSHEAEFDYLKSLEIEEKINQIAWCKRSGPSLMLLSTNEKTIKLWKIHEKRLRTVANFNVTTGPYGGHSPVSSLRIPSLSGGETTITTTPRRVYATAHAYHINSIAVNSDGQTFLSADDLRIHLWHLDNPSLSFNVVDIKPSTLEELTEVITAAEFHPHSCNVFVYSSSRGTIRLADMRESALCDRPSKVFQEAEDANARSYFNEVTAGVSDIEFTHDGRYIISRDYLTLKIWDPRMESRPVRVIPVHEHLRPRLMDLYESDCIFDKFEVSSSACSQAALAGLGARGGGPVSGGTGGFSGSALGGSAGPLSDSGSAGSGSAGHSSSSSSSSDGDSHHGGGGSDLSGISVITGSYNNTLRVYDLASDTETTIELSKTRPKPPTSRSIPALGGGSGNGGNGTDVAMDGSWGSDGGGFFGYGNTGTGGGMDRIDFTKKLLHCSFHPTEPIIAVAAAANLFIYSGL